jgi:hypothetical protein
MNKLLQTLVEASQCAIAHYFYTRVLLAQYTLLTSDIPATCFGCKQPSLGSLLQLYVGRYNFTLLIL